MIIETSVAVNHDQLPGSKLWSNVNVVFRFMRKTVAKPQLVYKKKLNVKIIKVIN